MLLPSKVQLSPIRVHPRVSAVQKGDRPFPHPRPSTCICGSKGRSPGTSKRNLPLPPIRVHQRASAVQKCDRPVRQKERSPIFNY
ncbi:hypothetical protein QUB60_16520 [Microcoleus sp. A2-C5]|uniref:hypothetical protein n=1 Tax=unclassified Microcoleus TaxID=2642155 RepID=UPI002FCE7A54